MHPLDGAVHPHVRRLVVLLVLAMLTPACVATASGNENAEEPYELPSWDEDPWDDDLDHYLVEWAPAAGDPAAPGGPSFLRSPARSEPSGLDGFDPIDPEHPLAPGQGTGGSGGPEDVVVDPGVDPTTTTAPAEEPDHPLEEIVGVEEVTEVRPGLLAVATSLTADQLAELPGVTSVAEDLPILLADEPGEIVRQWHLENTGQRIRGRRGAEGADIDAGPAWGRATGEGIVVAVIDTGVQLDHPDLAGNIWTNPGEVCGNGVDDEGNGFVDDCHGYDFARRTGRLVDRHGHGTHIAGTIAAVTDNGIGVAGVAPNAEIMAVKIGERSASLSAGIAGIEYAVANGADILNLSWGTSSLRRINRVPPLAKAIERAQGAGVLVVVAAGNAGHDIDRRPTLPASYGHENILTVGASNNRDRPARFSNRGARSVDVFAPGKNIRSTRPGSRYGWMSGTSMAAPTVAGTAALVWSAKPSADYAEVKAIILGSADHLPGFEGLSVVPGRVNAANAVGRAVPDVSYSLSGLADLEPGAAQAVSISAEGSSSLEAPGPLAYRTTLLARFEGLVYNVVGHDLTRIGDGATHTTDAHGQVVIAPESGLTSEGLGSDSATLSLDLGLPAGDFGLLVELVSMEGGDPEPVAEGTFVSFVVEEPEASATTHPPTTENPSGTPTSGTGDSAGSSSVDSGTGNATSGTGNTSRSSGGTGSSSTGGGSSGASSTASTGGSGTASTGSSGTGSTGSSSTGNPTTNTTTAAGDPTTGTGSTGSGSGSGSSSTGGTGSSSTGSPGSTGGTGSSSTGNPTTNTTTAAGAGPKPSPASSFHLRSVNPAQGGSAGGYVVHVLGEGFLAGSRVLIGGQPAPVVFQVEDKTLLARAPGGAAGLVDVEVVAPNGDRAALLDSFTYVPDGTSEGSSTQPGSPGGNGSTSGSTGTGSTTSTQPSRGGGTGGSARDSAAPTTTVAGQSSPSTTIVDLSPTTAPPSAWPPWSIELPSGLSLGPVDAAARAARVSADTFDRSRCEREPCSGITV